MSVSAGGTDWAAIIQASGIAIAAVLGALTLRKVADVKKEVVTGNAIKAGKVIGDGETRRVEDIPHDERTAAEQHHLDSAPEPDPPQGPGR